MSFDPEEFLDVSKKVRITGKSVGKPISQCSTLHIDDIGIIVETISPQDKRYQKLFSSERRYGRPGLFGTPVYMVAIAGSGQGIFTAMDLVNIDELAPPAYTLANIRMPGIEPR